MEISSLSSKPIILIPVVLTLIWIWRILNWAWLKPRKLERSLRAQGFSGNPYRLLFGDMKELSTVVSDVRSKPMNLSHDIVPRVFPLFQQQIKIHGKESFMWFGPSPRINVMNPSHIKDILTKIGDFPKLDSSRLFKLLVSGIAGYEGQKWATHRKIINPAFHVEKLKLMLPAFYASCNEMITKWDKLISMVESCEIDVWPDLQSLTSDAISRTAFGSSYEEGRKIFQLQKEQAELVTRIIQSPLHRIPGWSFLPTKTTRQMEDTAREIESKLREIISKRENEMREGGAGNNDLLGILLESNLREIGEHEGDKSFGMTIKDVIEECKLFYFAGQETTSVLLVWTLILLSMHPQWQSRAREEVLQVFGTSKLDYDRLSRLKIVTMIFHEVLRLYPPGIELVRTVQKETKLGNLILPAGVELSLPIILIQQDEEFWGADAKEFKPERFAEGVSKATKNPNTYFPFGWGPRICIGQSFAMVEAKLAIAMILQHYSFKLSPSYAHAPTTILTLQPQYGAQLILHRLQSD